MTTVTDLETRARLRAAINLAIGRANTRAMQWGVDDCALWCAEPIREVLGYDPAAHWRGRYRDRDGANATLRKTGLLGALRSVAKARGWKQIKPQEAQSGDIGLAILNGADGKLTQSTMICSAKGWFIGRTQCGVTALESKYVARAWAVI